MRQVQHYRRVLFFFLLSTAAALCGTAVYGEGPPKPAPAQFCVDLAGGGRVVGEPLGGDLQFQAEFGQIAIPWAGVRRVVPGLNCRPERLKRILDDIERLGDANFGNRQRAQRNLLADGPRLRLILEEFKNDGDAERRSRIRALLREIGSGDADGAAWLRQDVVAVADICHVGKIAAPFVEVKTRFGPLRIPLAEIESIAAPLDTAPIDLLAKIDLARGVVFGDWRMDGPTLVSPLQNRARLQIPVSPPANYDLRLTATAKSVWKAGARPDSLFVAVVIAGHQCNVALNCFGDVAGGPFSGLDLLDGRRTHQSPLHHGPLFDLNREFRIVVAVRGRTVAVTLDDRQLFRWDGDPARLSMCDQWGLNDARYLGLGTHRTSYHISRCQLVPIDESRRPANAATGEMLARFSDGSFLPARFDAGQTIVVPLGNKETKVPCASLAAIRPGPDHKGFRITLATGESFVVEKLPRQTINLTTRFGKLATPLDGIATLERARQSTP
jgi:hypothetical protein